MLFELFDAFSPRDHLSPGWSAVVVFGLAPGALGWLFLAMRRRARDAALELARYETPGEGLRLVEADVLADAEAEPAARIRVEEAETQRQGRHRAYTVWVERESHLTARPFSVREGDGRVTRVEPGDAPYVDRRAAAEAVSKVVRRPEARTRFFVLEPGSRVFVYGRVAACAAAPSGGDGYRDVVHATALGPPGDGPLEVHAASPVPALRSELGRARRWQLLCPVALALVGAVPFSMYLAQAAAGRTVDATVTRVSTARERGWAGTRYGGRSTSYAVRVACASPTDRAEATRWGEVCSRVADGDDAALWAGVRVRVLTVDGWPEAVEVGDHASLHWLAAAFGLSAVMMFIVSAPRGPVAPWRAPSRKA